MLDISIMLSKYDLANLIKIYKLYNTNELNIFLENPSKIKNKKLKISFIKLIKSKKNPLKSLRKYYKLYLVYKNQLGGTYPGDGYLAKYLKHNEQTNNKITLPSIDDLKIDMSLNEDAFIENLPDEKLKKIYNELENEVLSKIKNIDIQVKNNLNSKLQYKIREELKQKILKEIKEDFNRNINDLSKNLPIKKEIYNEIYTDSRPPFF